MTQLDEQARLVFHLSKEEAMLLGAPAVDVQHVLLGLLREGGLAAQALNSHGLTLERARVKAGSWMTQETPARQDSPPITLDAKKLVEGAAEQARLNDDETVNSGHILLAVIRDENPVVHSLLEPLVGGSKGVMRQVLTMLKEIRAKPKSKTARLEQTQPLKNTITDDPRPLLLSADAVQSSLDNVMLADMLDLSTFDDLGRDTSEVVRSIPPRAPISAAATLTSSAVQTVTAVQPALPVVQAQPLPAMIPANLAPELLEFTTEYGKKHNISSLEVVALALRQLRNANDAATAKEDTQLPRFNVQANLTKDSLAMLEQYRQQRSLTVDAVLERLIKALRAFAEN
jgi:hypothetical protein